MGEEVLEIQQRWSHDVHCWVIQVIDEVDR